MPVNNYDEYAVSTSMMDTPRAVAGLVIGALIALILIRRGFRGVNVGGVSVGVK